jgi:hypothetical protein
MANRVIEHKDKPIVRSAKFDKEFREREFSSWPGFKNQVVPFNSNSISRSPTDTTREFRGKAHRSDLPWPYKK